MTIKDLLKALAELTRWLQWERESIEDFHEYAQAFGGQPGSNVYTFVLRDALRHRGLTLEQFRKRRKGGSRA